ncbi:TIGR03067 domain-containing protein [Pukyongiella litopenaei]|uniref:TIGR03067 domain-containing protein n=1 Tax=Pukyongiella litopenaei TaxID=2605946 RepID=A0A2S0MLI5_9RHOB|nr:TIGR03067 domain-containing protein [Pukyongiella litopenaei]
MIGPADDAHTARGAACIFERNEFRDVRPDSSVRLKGGQLDATTSPGSITRVGSIGEETGKALPAIFALTGDSFRFDAADEGQPRPARFKTVAGLTMRAFRRVN